MVTSANAAPEDVAVPEMLCRIGELSLEHPPMAVKASRRQSNILYILQSPEFLFISFPFLFNVYCSCVNFLKILISDPSHDAEIYAAWADPMAGRPFQSIGQSCLYLKRSIRRTVIYVNGEVQEVH